MRFGEVLLVSQVPEWRAHYLPYNHLKALLNRVVGERVASGVGPGPGVAAEGLATFLAFKGCLDEHIQAIGHFYSLTRDSLLADVDFFCVGTTGLSPPLDAAVAPPAMSSGSGTTGKGPGDAIPTSASTSPRSLALKGPAFHSHLYEIFRSLHQLQRFAQINVMGIQKIVKKHDKLTLGTLGPEYAARLPTLPFHDTEALDSAIAALTLLSPALPGRLEQDAAVRPRALPFAELRAKENYIIDMDGVLYHGSRLLPGVPEFIDWLQTTGKKFLFLTVGENSSDKTPAMLCAKLRLLGIQSVREEHFYTSALSTAQFLATQEPGGRALVLGDQGLQQALLHVGYTLTSSSPHYVVVGETSDAARYHYGALQQAVNCVRNGARLIGTNLDVVDNAETGFAPACGALVAPIEAATGKKAYFLGKPNPLMMTSALARLGGSRASTIILGDRMDTDVLGGVESGIDTLLLLSGVTALEDVPNFAYRPRYVLSGVAELLQVLFANLPSAKDLLPS